MRTACYARFSSDLQRDTSLDDQIRSCREYAERQRWTWQDDQVYTDAGISGASLDGRPGVQAILTMAAVRQRPFDVLLVDDSSRIARDLADAVRVLQLLIFSGVRVVYITQGIDSAHEQAETLVAVHGIIDQLYLREMAAKIRRGLKGQHARGFATGGITYGYRSVRVPDPNDAERAIGWRLEVEPTEAAVVQQIFTWYAEGFPMLTMLARLHAARTPSPRGAGSRGLWRVGAIRRLLRNERYLGRQIWGQTRAERKPGRRPKTQRPLAASEWQVAVRPELRIIDDALWQRVEQRREALALLAADHRQRQRALLRGRVGAIHAGGLFGGRLFCSCCGKAVIIVSRHTIKGVRYAYYGCCLAWKNGDVACTNRVTTRAEALERRLLEGLQRELLRPETVQYITDAIAGELQRLSDQRPVQRETLVQQQDELRQKVARLVHAIEQGGSTESVIDAVKGREVELAAVSGALAALDEDAPDDRRVRVMPTWVRQQLGEIGKVLSAAPERARVEFDRMHVRFTFMPVYDVPAGQRPFLRATGESDFARCLSGDEAESALPASVRSRLQSHGSRKFEIDLPATDRRVQQTG